MNFNLLGEKLLDVVLGKLLELGELLSREKQIRETWRKVMYSEIKSW